MESYTTYRELSRGSMLSCLPESPLALKELLLTPLSFFSWSEAASVFMELPARRALLPAPHYHDHTSPQTCTWRENTADNPDYTGYPDQEKKIFPLI